jgi:hypothetical protein
MANPSSHPHHQHSEAPGAHTQFQPGDYETSGKHQARIDSIGPDSRLWGQVPEQFTSTWWHPDGKHNTFRDLDLVHPTPNLAAAPDTPSGQARFGADAQPPAQPQQHNDTPITIALTPDQRTALSALLANAITDTISNRKAKLYQAILAQIAAPIPQTIDITGEAALAGAKVLAATLGVGWDGLHPGRVDPQYPAWRTGCHANAR